MICNEGLMVLVNTNCASSLASKLNDALGLVDDIALTGFFRYHIRAGGQLGEVDLAVLIGGKFLGAVITELRS